MSNFVESFVEALTKGLYKKPRSGTYTPTLVVGLGGTGLKVLRSLKKYTLRNEVEYIRLLGIDTDKGENDRFLDLPQLDERELAILDAGIAVNYLKNAIDGDPDYSFVNDFLPEQIEGVRNVHSIVEDKIRTGEGAGQFRRAGKLVFDANVNNGARLKQRIDRIHHELTGMAQVARNESKGTKFDNSCRIFVVGSIAGGTGAGSLIDCLGLLRWVFDGPNDKISCISLLPGDLLSQQLTDPVNEMPITHGNAIGVLREFKAFREGYLKNYTFKFDPTSSYTLRKGLSIADSFILVDQEDFDGTPVYSWFELCKGVGYYLYGLLGTGAGLTKAAGGVNFNPLSKADEDMGLFSSFGVSVVEYPAEQMARYVLIRALQTELPVWLKSDKRQEDVTNSATGLLSAVKLNSFDDLSINLVVENEIISLQQFWQTEGTLKQALRFNDDTFLKKSTNRLNGVSGRFKEMERELVNNKNQFLQKAESTLYQAACDAAGPGLQDAIRSYRKLKSLLEDAHTQLGVYQSDLSKDIKSKKVAIKKLTRTIERRPGWMLEGKKRRQYVSSVNTLIVRMTRQYCLPSYLEVYKVLINIVDGILADLEDLKRAIGNLLGQLPAEIASAEDEIGQKGFRHSLIEPAELEEKVWKPFGKLSASNVSPSGLTAELVLKTRCADYYKSIVSYLNGFNVVADVKKDPSMQMKVKAASKLSKPLCNLSHIVQRGELKPQSFVVSTASNDSTSFLKHFEETQGENVKRIPFTNGHMAICLRTMDGFPMQAWKKFTHAVGYHRQNPAYFETLPIQIKLPEILDGGGDHDERSRLMAIAWATNGLLLRGSRFYANLIKEKDGQEVSWVYLTQNKDLSQLASSMMETTATDYHVEQATAVRVKAEAKIGDSLEKTFENLGLQQWQPLLRNAEDFLDQYKAVHGSRPVCDLLETFMQDTLVKGLQKADRGSTRYEIFENLIAALKDYCSELG